MDVFQSLDKACQNFAVVSELHALVLVTPLEGIEPSWERFREEYLACSEDDPVRVVGGLVRRNAKCRAVSVLVRYVRWWHCSYLYWRGPTQIMSLVYAVFLFGSTLLDAEEIRCGMPTPIVATKTSGHCVRCVFVWAGPEAACYVSVATVCIVALLGRASDVPPSVVFDLETKEFSGSNRRW